MNKSPQIPICWKREDVGKAISIKAKIDEKQTHYFLACHSPVTQIQDTKSKRKVTEEDLYKNLIKSSQRDKQVVIFGEPGTGKSHLVHWLKLRFDYGVETGELEDVVPVLIERRTGSLKDALSQLIEQCPQVELLCVSGQMGGLILIDEQANPLTNYISWRDQRTLASDGTESVLSMIERQWLASGCFISLGRELQAGSTTAVLACMNSHLHYNLPPEPLCPR